MEKEFVSYEQAVALKELGFNEICMGYFDVRLEHQIGNFNFTEIKGYYESVSALSPLKQQVFRWFRDKHRLNSIVFNDDGDVEYGNLRFNYEIRSITYSFDDILTYYDSYVGSYFYKTYEEAENASLNRLIELVKKENNGTTLDSTE